MTYDQWKLSDPGSESLENNHWTKCTMCKKYHWSQEKCSEARDQEYEYQDREHEYNNDKEIYDE